MLSCLVVLFRDLIVTIVISIWGTETDFCCFPTDVFERIRGSNKAEVQLNNFWQNNRARCNGFPSLIPVKFRASHSVSYSASPTHVAKVTWVVVSNVFYFQLYLGKSSDLTNICQVGWNNQLVTISKLLRTIELPFVLNIIFICLFFESLFQSDSKNRSKALNDTLPHKFGAFVSNPLRFGPNFLWLCCLCCCSNVYTAQTQNGRGRSRKFFRCKAVTRRIISWGGKLRYHQSTKYLCFRGFFGMSMISNVCFTF